MISALHLFWFFIGTAVIFIIVSIGLQHRTRWMWYLGWVMMFVLSGVMGAIVWGRIATAATKPIVLVNGLVYLGVGLAIWVPVAVWWSTHRGEFGRNKEKSDETSED